MQTITSGLETILNNSSQVVTPNVVATFADSKYAYNLKAFSDSEGWNSGLTRKEPTLWYKFDDIDLIQDHSGNGFDIDPSGATVSAVSGPIGYGDNGAYDFSSGSPIGAVPHNTLMSAVDGVLTWGAWIDVESISATGLIMMKGDYLSVTPGSVSWTLIAYYNGTANEMKWMANASNGSTLYTIDSDAFSTVGHGWDFVVGVVDGTSFKLYVNGALVDSTTMASALDIVEEDFNIMGGIEGKVDEMFVIQDALTAEEILSLYNNGVSTLEDTYADFFSPLQAINGFKEETLPVAESDGLDEIGNSIVANGEWYAISSEIDHFKTEVGWRSRSLSDGSGDFAEPETLTVRFDARQANYIDVHTAYSKGKIYEYDLYYFTSAGVKTLLDSYTMAETDYVNSHSLGGTLSITGIQIEISSTWQAVDYARVHELDPVYRIDVSDDVVSLDISSSRENFEDTLPIGHNETNTLDITFDNTTGDYSPYSGGTYSDFVVPDVRFDVSFSWEGASDEVLQGTFFADSWSLSSNDMTAQASCRDLSKRFEETTDEQGVFFQDISAGRAITTYARKNGVPGRLVDFYDNHTLTVSRDSPISLWELGKLVDSDGEIVETVETDGDDDFTGNYVLDAYGDWNGATIHVATVDGAGFRPGAAGIISSVPDSMSGYFPGDTADSGLNIADDAAFDLDSSWSIEFVAKPLAIPSTNASVIIAKGNSSFTNTNYIVALSTSGFFGVSVYNGGVLTTQNSSVPVVVGNVYHVVAAYDGSAGTLTIWVNGVSDQSTGLSAACTANSEIIRVGYLYDSGDTTWSYNGYLQNLAIFNYALDASTVAKHHVAAFIDNVKQFPYLYSIQATVLDAMIEWSTADLGVFYFGPDGTFHYDYRNTLHDTVLDQYATSQYDFADDTNIIDGAHEVELQSNKIKIEVNNITSINSDTQTIWRAEDNESLAVTGLRAELGKYATTVSVNNTSRPAWKKTGFIKIDDEIMSYDGITGTEFLNLERGLFGTSPALHNGDFSWTFEDSDFGWEGRTDWTQANCVVKRTEDEARTGSASLLVKSKIRGEDMDVVDEDSETTGLWEEMGPCSPRGTEAIEVFRSTSYTASAYTKAGTQTALTRLRLVWFDKNGNFISNETGTGATNSLAGWTQITVTGTSPSNAKYAAVRVLFGDPGSDFSDVDWNDIHYIDDVTLPGARCKVREVREYDIEFDNSPAVGVKYPLLTAADFENRAEIDIFEYDHFTAHIVVSATKSAAIKDVVYLEGTDPLTDLNYYFAIAGIPLIEKRGSDSVESATTELSDYARRFGFKELTITNKFIQDKEYAQEIADWLIQYYENPVPIISLTVTGVPHLELGDRVTITSLDQLGITDLDYWVMNNSISYDGGINQTLELRRCN